MAGLVSSSLYCLYSLLAQAKLVLSSSAVQRIAYSAQYTQTGSSTSAQDKYNEARVTKPLQILSVPPAELLHVDFKLEGKFHSKTTMKEQK